MEKMYQVDTNGGIVDLINVEDLGIMASQVIPADGYGYINSGAGNLFTYQKNEQAFNHQLIIPHILRDVELPDIITHSDEETLTTPVIMAPAVAHGLAHVKTGKASAKGVAGFGTVYTASSYTSCTLEEIRKVGGERAPQWFRSHMSKDDGINLDILEVAKCNGARATVLTAGTVVSGNRETDRRSGLASPLPMLVVQAYRLGVDQTMDAVYKSSKQKLSPKDVEFIAAHSDLPAYMKGVQSEEDIHRPLESGAGGVWVSNRGGRQLDGDPTTFDLLQYVAEAVDKCVPVVSDSGVWRGQHAFKAIVLGTDLVTIGRPVIYGPLLGGSTGVR